MPTPAGLPKAGEVWERRYSELVGKPATRETHVTRFVVLHRGRGDYWSLSVFVPPNSRYLWVDASYWLAQNELFYVGPAGPQTKKKLGLG